MAPVIMGNDDRPELGEELTNSFCRTDPDIAAPLRARDVPLRQPRRPVARARRQALVLQCSDDAIAPAGRRRVRPRARCATARSCSSRRRPLPEPQRAGGDDRRHPSVPRRRVTSPDDALRTPPRTSSRTRPAATCRRGWTARSSGSTRRSRRWTGRARDDLLGGRRLQDLLSPGGADLLRDAPRAAAAHAGLGARDRRRDRARRRDAPARAAQLRVRSLDGGDDGAAEPAGRPHDGLRRDRPAPLRAGARCARAGASRTSPSELQRSLLSGDAARPPAASTSASPTGPAWPAWRSAATGTTRSGSTRARRVALVVGDVVGRGITAAATMGQLRSAVRALAVDRPRARRAARRRSTATRAATASGG